MATVAPLSMPLILEAVDAENLKYSIDGDGDAKLMFGRDKGKDIIIYVMNPEKTNGFLVMMSIVMRFFKQEKVPELLVLCNTWNRDRRVPRAFVNGPDSDGDFTVRLDHQVLCDSGVHRDLIQENLSIFIGAGGRFWDDLDEAM